MNILKIAQRLSHNFKDKSDLNDVYDKIRMDKGNLKISFERLSPQNYVKLIFLIWAIKNNKNPEEILDSVNSRLFSFSLVRFDDLDPDITCGNCDGEGEFKCDNCNGSGTEECISCDGEGSETCMECGGIGDLVNDDGKLERCSECGGNGSIQCDTCDGEGTIYCRACGSTGSFTCGDCNGHGSIESEDHVNFTVYSYVSTSQSVLDRMLIANEVNSPLDDELEFYIDNNSLLINIDVVIAWNYPDITENINPKFKGELFVNKLKEIMDYNIGVNNSLTYPIYVSEISDVDKKFTKD